MFRLNAVPHTSVSVAITLLPYACPTDSFFNVSGMALSYPSHFTFDKNSRSNTDQNFVVRGDPGCYRMFLDNTVSESSVDMYANTSVSLRILTVGSDIPPPRLFKAIFSHDGRVIEVVFNSPTDRGVDFVMSTRSKFMCSQLLHMKGIPDLTCMWQSDSVLSISLSSEFGVFVNVGDEVTLLGDRIKAACSPTSSCDSFVYGDEDTIKISHPPLPLYPSVSLQASSLTLSNCSDLVLDPSQSTNKGGSSRPWSRIQWFVTGSGGNIMDIENSLNLFYTNETLSSFTVGAEFLRVGQLSVTLQLENFFGNVASSSVTINVVSEDAPSTSVFGPGIMELYRWKTLELYSDASLRLCKNDTGEFLELSYSWAGYSGVIFDPSLQSVSLNPRTFRLNPYSLDVATTYNFVVSVSNDISLPVIHSTKVTVIRSGVYAEIVGGGHKYVSSADVVDLDASKSSDLDYPDSAQISFLWACVELAPVFGNACNVSLSNNAQHTVEAAHLVSRRTTDIKFQFTVKVTGYDGLYSTANTIVTVVAQMNLPSISVLGLQRKYSSSDAVVLSCNVITDADISVHWNSSDLNLADVATTALQKNIFAPSSFVFRLALRPNALVPGEIYSFQFFSSHGFNSTTSRVMSEVTIHMNEAPVGGRLEVSPGMGFAFNTSFSLSSVAWDDDISDFPLKYLFISYSDDRNDATVLKTQSIITQIKAGIPQGFSSTGYVVICEAIVSDIYQSAGSANTTAVVRPLDSSKLRSLATEQLGVALLSYNAELATRVISSTTTALNSVDCSEAPACMSSLHRYSCQATPNTCGECLPGFVGVPGHSNEQCFLESEVLGVGAECTSHAMCSTGLCVNSTCTHRNRECVQDCTGPKHGSCVAFDYAGEIMTDNCTYGNYYCEVNCICRDDWKGVDCSVDPSEFAFTSDLREKMCAGLLSSVHFSDVLSGDVIVARARAITALFADTSLLTISALHNCSSALILSLKNDEDIHLLSRDDVGISILQSLSKISRMEALLPAWLAQEVSDAFLTLATARLLKQVAGGEISTLMSQDIRMGALKAYFSGANGTSIVSPTTTYEAILGSKHVTTVQFDSSSSEENGEFGMSITENSNSNANTLSNPVHIVSGFDDTTAVTERRLMMNNMKVTVELPNYQAVNYTRLNILKDDFGCIKQDDDMPYNLTISCASVVGSGTTYYSVICPGNKRGNIHYSCPGYTSFPQCVTFNGTSYERDVSCTVEKYSTTQVTCVCGGMGSSSRWLQSGSSSSLSLSITSFLQDTLTGFEATFSATLEEQPDTFKAVPLLFSCVVGTAAMFLFVSQLMYLRDKKRKRKKGNDNDESRNLFESALPVELSEKSWEIRFIEKLKEVSIVGGALSSTKKKSRRIMRGVLLLLTVSFVDLVVALYIYNDDGTCKSISSENLCSEEKIPIFGQHSCEWNSVDDWCAFKRPNQDFLSILILIIMVLLISVPVALVLFAFVDVVFASFDISLKYSSFKVSSLVFIDSFIQRKSSTAKMDIFFDNWEKGYGKKNYFFQSPRMKMILAGRIEVMRKRMDDISIDDEACLMGITSRKSSFLLESQENSVLSEFLDDKSMPPGGIALHGSLKLAKKEIINARAKALTMNSEMDLLVGDHAKEIMLLRYFLVSSLAPHKRDFAMRYLCSTTMCSNFKLPVPWKVKCCFWFILLYILLVSFLIISGGFYLDISAVNVWGKVACYAIFGYLFILEVAHTFVIYVLPVDFIRTDVVRMHNRLRDMGKFISRRSVIGAMPKSSNNYLHHFNPACRLARIRPKHFMSKMLVQLNDMDIPSTYASRPKYSSRLCACVMTFFLMLAKFPPLLSDIVVYFVLLGILGFFCTGLFYLFEYSVVLGVLILAILVYVLVVLYRFASSKPEVGNEISQSTFRRFFESIFFCKIKVHGEYTEKSDSYDCGENDQPTVPRKDLPKLVASRSFDSSYVPPPSNHPQTRKISPHFHRAVSMGTPSEMSNGYEIADDKGLQRLKDELNDFHMQLESLKKQNSSLKLISLTKRNMARKDSRKVYVTEETFDSNKEPLQLANREDFSEVAPISNEPCKEVKNVEDVNECSEILGTIPTIETIEVANSLHSPMTGKTSPQGVLWQTTSIPKNKDILNPVDRGQLSLDEFSEPVIMSTLNNSPGVSAIGGEVKQQSMRSTVEELGRNEKILHRGLYSSSDLSSFDLGDMLTSTEQPKFQYTEQQSEHIERKDLEIRKRRRSLRQKVRSGDIDLLEDRINSDLGGEFPSAFEKQESEGNFSVFDMSPPKGTTRKKPIYDPSLEGSSPGSSSAYLRMTEKFKESDSDVSALQQNSRRFPTLDWKYY